MQTISIEGQSQKGRISFSTELIHRKKITLKIKWAWGSASPTSFHNLYDGHELFTQLQIALITELFSFTLHLSPSKIRYLSADMEDEISVWCLTIVKFKTKIASLAQST